MRETIKLVLDSQQRIVLYADRRAFTFGLVRTRWTDPVKPTYLFVPESVMLRIDKSSKTVVGETWFQ